MNTWYAEKDHPDNQKKRPFIVEIFKVAKQHERYMKGEVGKLLKYKYIIQGTNILFYR